MKTACFLFLFLFFSAGATAQLDSLPVKTPGITTMIVSFEDTTQVPLVEAITGKMGRPQIRSKNSRLLPFYQGNKLVNVAKAFPAAAHFAWHPKAAKLLSYYLLTFEKNTDSVLTDLRKIKQPPFTGEVYAPPSMLYTPNDYYTNTGGQPVIQALALEYIGARQAWDITKGDPAIKIGISDINFDINSPELSGKTFLVPGIIASSNGGHGTRVASIAAGATDNGTGMPSIGFNCGLIVVPSGYDGILEAVYRGARVINCSWTNNISTLNSGTIHNEVIDLVTSLGITMVAAAGNGELGANNYAFPAAADNVISVTSVGHAFEIGHPSNINWKDVHDGQVLYPANETHTHNDRVDICAPGYAVLSVGKGTTPSYGWGSSFAAPFVSGTVGLIYSVYPAIKPNEVEEIIKCTAVNIDNIPNNLPYAGKLGAGRLNAAAAVAKAKEKINKPRPRDISWYGIVNGREVPIEPAAFRNYSTLVFKVEGEWVSTGSVYEWQINSLSKIITKTGTAVSITLQELGLQQGNNTCQRLEVSVRQGSGCAAGYYFTEKQTCLQADFNYAVGENNPCESLRVNFYNRTFDGETFSWDFGDGTTSIERDPVHIYTSPGTKQVKLLVNGTVSVTKAIAIGIGNIYVDGQSDYIAACSGLPISLIYESAGCGSNFVWNFGDGTPTATGRSVTHTFNGNGPYQVKLTIDGIYTVQKQLEIHPPYDDFIITPLSQLCTNNRFRFLLRSERDQCVSTVEWNFGNGQRSTLLQPPVVQYAAGTYTVKLKINNSYVITKQVRAQNGPPDFDYTTDYTNEAGSTVCIAGLPVKFTSPTECVTSYAWDFGDGTTSTLQNPVKTFQAAGIYTVKLTLNNNSQLVKNNQVTVSCGRAINSAVTAITERSATITWTSLGKVNNYSLSYKKTGDNSVTTVQANSATYSLSELSSGTNYTYTITGNCTSGTSAVLSGQFTTETGCSVPLPAVTVTSTIAGIPCAGATLQLNANTIAGVAYQWTGPNNFSSNLQNPVIYNITTANSGRYTCTLLKNGCTGTPSFADVNIFANPAIPSALLASFITSTSAQLSWTSTTPGSQVVLQYKLPTDNTWSTVSNASNPYLISGLLASKNYTWQVKTDMLGCQSDWSAISSFATTAANDCAAPANSTVSAVTPSSAQISWPPAGNSVTTYQLEYRLAGAAGYTLLNDNITGSTTISTTLSSLKPATNYQYRVTPRCMPGSTLSRYFTEGQFTTADCLLPTLNPVSGISAAAATINWTAVVGNTGYKLELKQTGAAIYTELSPAPTATTTSFTVTNLQSSTTYEYRLTPLCGAGTGIGYVTGRFTTLPRLCSGTTVLTTCQGTITDGSGISRYENNMNCSWGITVPGANSITLKFTNFSTEAGKDVVNVYTGSNATSANLIGSYSGNYSAASLPTLSIEGNAAFITFASNSTVPANGWEATYYSSLCIPAVSKNSNTQLVNRVLLYPNPFIDNITIELMDEIPDAELVLTNDKGMVVYKKHYDLMAKQTQLDFGATLPPADYMLTIRTAEELLYRQQLVNKKRTTARPVEIQDDELGSTDISLYPNPYVDNLNVKVKKELKNVVLLLMDMQGRVMYKKEFAVMSGNTQLDFGRTLPAGVYFLVIRNSHDILFRQRVIAQK